jgi:hypothetical protein
MLASFLDEYSHHLMQKNWLWESGGEDSRGMRCLGVGMGSWKNNFPVKNTL